MRLVIVTTSPRAPVGCLTKAAWSALAEGSVCTAYDDHPQAPALANAGIGVQQLPAEAPPSELAQLFMERAEGDRPAVWLAAPDGDEAFARALGELVGDGSGVELEIVTGSYDVPGARLLDAVAVMDRLRSPGGCPWDAEQTHQSLAPYLLEEAYEAYQTIEDGDLPGLRDELGDVLLQVLFHSRLAEERPVDDTAAPGFSIDDVAAGLVDKLIRRHPHVFADADVSGAADVQRNWDAVKMTESGEGASIVDGVALGQPALALATKLQTRAARAGLPVDLGDSTVAGAPSVAMAVSAAAGAVEERATEHTGEVVQAVGELLFAAVALAREYDVDAEAALRGVARRFRDRLAGEGVLSSNEEEERVQGRDG